MSSTAAKAELTSRTTTGAKALMPVQAKALLPDEVEAFLTGKVAWRILAVPFGGPADPSHFGIAADKAPLGVDLDGQWFSERTDIYGGYAALKASKERVVDWHHNADPTGMMRGTVLGKAVLDGEPQEDGWWADLWVKYGEARLAKIKALLRRGGYLFGSGQPTHPFDTAVDPDTGEITRYPLIRETLSTSPQNTYAVVRPKAVLDDFDTADITVSGELRDLLTELDALGTDLPQTFRGHGGEAAAKAGVLTPADERRAISAALETWESYWKPDLHRS